MSSSLRKGPEEPRLRFRPVRLGTVTLSSTLFVVTADESRRLAKGSSGRNETEIRLLSSSLSLLAGSSFESKPCEVLLACR
jgi:hypothetical protein